MLLYQGDEARRDARSRGGGGTVMLLYIQWFRFMYLCNLLDLHSTLALDPNTKSSFKAKVLHWILSHDH